MNLLFFGKTAVNDANSQHRVEVAVNTRPRWIIPTIALLIVFIVGLFAVDRLFNPQQFQIKEIEVHGHFDHVDGAHVKQIVEAALKGNYFSVSLQRLENEIKQIPWVFSASLRRQWPSTIVVYVTEVQPVARWGDEQWLNFTGDLVDRQPGYQPRDEQENDRDLPLLFAADEQKHIVWKAFQQWSERFASSGISLEELRLDSRDLWWLKLSLGALALNGDQSAPLAQPLSLAHGKIIARPLQVTMVVDKQHSFSRIQRFIEALNQEFIIQFPQMKTIDLRYPNGFAIGWRSQVVAQHIVKSGFDDE